MIPLQYSHRKRPRRVSFIVVLLFLSGITRAVSQEPDGRGEISLSVPEYKGVSASAPIPAEMHIKNEGGSDGSGLCVIASVVINGTYQGVPGVKEGKGSELWKAAKSRPGGYYPQKLEDLLKEVVPGEKWTSVETSDPQVLDTLSRKGFPIGVTMNTAALYGYKPIHHMVSLIEYRTGGLACVVDNNNPGIYSWMPAKEFARRWIDGNEGWAFAWSRSPKIVKEAVAVFALASAFLVMSSGVLLVGGYQISSFD